ncbi:hypothetical protein ABNG02_06380 [Halorubrum ejinorense]|uniref:UDP-2,4-diacetamido-2,4,6-trideoxy-beta-L-altropyranose hydrolase n=2 Tax=Halorubrum ejinorense TaxID=425309 RepID=A0ABV4IMV9_9EURY
MYVVVRADGGPEIGYGHLVRTGALASELLARGHEVTYVTTTPDHVREVCPDGVGTVTISSREDPTPVREFTRDNADVTVVDSYLADGAYQRELRTVTPLTVIADDTRHQIAADILINGNLYAPELTYETIGEEPEWCLGPKYLLLRPEITAHVSRDSPWREPPTRAIVTMGGSDVKELTPTVIRAFDGLDIRVDAIVGPGCTTEQEQAIHNAARTCSADVRVARDPDDLVDRMAQADFGVSTASSTTYELLALGTPIVSISIVDNQEPIAAALRDRDMAIVLERQIDTPTIMRAVKKYIQNPDCREKKQKRGKSLVDALGTKRVVSKLIEYN